jgi:hypothetical protein
VTWVIRRTRKDVAGHNYWTFEEGWGSFEFALTFTKKAEAMRQLWSLRCLEKTSESYTLTRLVSARKKIERLCEAMRKAADMLEGSGSTDIQVGVIRMLRTEARKR